LARAEFLLIGVVAGGLAGACAAIAGHLLARHLFMLDYPFDARSLLVGVFIGPLVVWLAGALATRQFYRGSPMQLMRESAND
jgi:predicted lysophospholipase L1 biosynthesis ABC-type transport system permease subunit